MNEFPWEDAATPASNQADAGTDAETGAGADPGAAPAQPGSAATDEVPAGRRTDGAGRPVARKEYYAIGEVADLVGLPAHVLRYWESQFSVLNPSKNRSGNRVYQRKEIRVILLVKQLLHEEKYTVEGAKQRLEQLKHGGGLRHATAGVLDDQILSVLREDLAELGALLSSDAQ